MGNIQLPVVFTTYNPTSRIERTLAIRLHTLGGVHGYKMYLPDRSEGTKKISQETKNRIGAADFFILFSTANKTSKTVLEEIDIAWNHFKDKSRIIIIYDRPTGKNLQGGEHCTEIFIDSEKMSFEDINKIVFSQLSMLKLSIVPAKNLDKPKSDQTSNILGGLILAGVGLLLLGALLETDD